MALEENKNPASLEGTLDEAPTAPESQFANFRNLMDKSTKMAYQNNPSISETLGNFMTKVGGKGVITPGEAGAVVGQETQRKVQSVSDIYRNTLRQIQAMEQTRTRVRTDANNLIANLAQSGVLHELGGDEVNNILATGFLSDEGAINLSELMQTKAEEAKEKDKNYQYVKGTADQPSGTFDPSTGEFTPSPEAPFKQFESESNLGNLTVTGLGSDLWEHGLDVVLAGGQRAPVKSSIQGEVIFAGENAGFGNQVRIRVSPLDEAGQPISTADSEEIWFSHLGSLNVKPGDVVDPNTILGIQGNTGQVLGGSGEQLSAEQIEQGRGTHLDVTMRNPDGTFKTPNEVSEFLGVKGGEQGATGNIEDLTATQRSRAASVAKQLYGTIKTADQIEQFLNPILQRMADGENIDEIADDLRLAGQSPEFSGAIRNAAQQITSDWTDKKTQTAFDKLDDLVTGDNVTATQDFLKKLAIDGAGVEQGKQIMGQERTVDFLDEIADDLKAFEDAGGDTNIFTGTLEEIARKAGLVKEPELRKVAVKITKARQQYRRAMTGVAFSPGENLEYDKVFPDINKTAEFNTAVINGLRESFRGDVDFFYGFMMGEDAYGEIFKQSPGEQTIERGGMTFKQNEDGSLTRIK